MGRVDPILVVPVLWKFFSILWLLWKIKMLAHSVSVFLQPEWVKETLHIPVTGTVNTPMGGIFTRYNYVFRDAGNKFYLTPY